MKIKVDNVMAVFKDGTRVIVTKLRIENKLVTGWKDSKQWYSMTGITLEAK